MLLCFRRIMGLGERMNRRVFLSIDGRLFQIQKDLELDQCLPTSLYI